MEFVEPIRDKKQLEAMKKILRASNIRDYCLFILGINSGLRISDLLSLRISDVTDERGKVRDRIMLREKKTSKLNPHWGQYQESPEGVCRYFGHCPQSTLIP